MTKQTKDKRYECRYSQQNIDAHGSETNLKKAVLAVRDLNKEALTEIINKIK